MPNPSILQPSPIGDVIVPPSLTPMHERGAARFTLPTHPGQDPPTPVVYLPGLGLHPDGSHVPISTLTPGGTSILEQSHNEQKGPIDYFQGVEIPLGPTPQLSECSEKRTYTAQDDTISPIRSPKILLVEDNPINVSLNDTFAIVELTLIADDVTRHIHEEKEI